MEEKKYLYLIVFSTFILGIIGSYLSKNFDLRLIFPKLYVDYSAEINIDNQISINEKYHDYLQTERYRRLFRKWHVPITVDEELNRPYIKIESVYGDYESYVKDWKGVIHGEFKSKAALDVLRKFAKNNEAGIVNPNYYKKGEYLLFVDYKVFPPFERDSKLVHLNFKLADYHVPYKNVEIKIKDNKNLILKIFPHVPNFSVKKEQNSYIIQGNAPANSLVEVEMLLKPFNIEGFPRNIKNIKKITESVNKNLFLVQKINKTLQNLFLFIVILFPFFFVAYYIKFGSEKEFTVPEFLSFIPNKKRKPYLVNLVFNGDSFDGDENAFYSTLLDLQKKGKIKIETNGDISIKVLDKNVEDTYEKMVIAYLLKNSVDLSGEKVFFPSLIKSKIDEYIASRNVYGLKALKSELDSVLHYENPSISQQFVESRGKNLITVIGFLFFIITLVLAGFSFKSGWIVYSVVDIYPLFILSLTLSAQILVVAITPTQFLGRWRKDFYKEKLEWEAFKNFLSDLAMIKKYKPEDISIWKEWLIYGTALGVADKVEKAMESFNIEIPEIKDEYKIRTHFYSTYSSLNSGIAKLTASSSSSGSGGGFGAGGGFGGGGAGGG